MIEKNNISEYENEKAVLVGLITQTQGEAKAKEYLNELAFLAETAGAETVKTFLQLKDICRKRKTRRNQSVHRRQRCGSRDF